MMDDFEIDPNWAMTNAKTQITLAVLLFIILGLFSVMLIFASEKFFRQIHGRGNNGNGIDTKLVFATCCTFKIDWQKYVSMTLTTAIPRSTPRFWPNDTFTQLRMEHFHFSHNEKFHERTTEKPEKRSELRSFRSLLQNTPNEMVTLTQTNVFLNHVAKIS